MYKSIKKARSGEAGFTLIELLIVVIILAILAAIVVFAVGATGTDSAIAACKADAKSVETAVEAYKAQMGVYPPAITDLTSAATTPSGGTSGPWLKSVPDSTHYTISYDGSTTGTLTIENSKGTNGESFETKATACEDNAAT